MANKLLFLAFVVVALVSITEVAGKPKSIEVCSLSPEVGLCRAAIPRFYFNPLTRQCEQFTYGGCGGNDNRFATVDDCIQICGNAGNEAK